MAARHGRSSRGQRDAPDVASPPSLLDPLDRLALPSPWGDLVRPVADDFDGPLADLADARRWSPERYPRAIRLSSARPALSSSMRISGKKPAFFSPVISFAHPQTVVQCVRRKQRREVLLATGKAAKGARARFRRRNTWSNVSCRR